jgi:hypothetical protein
MTWKKSKRVRALTLSRLVWLLVFTTPVAVVIDNAEAEAAAAIPIKTDHPVPAEPSVVDTGSFVPRYAKTCVAVFDAIHSCSGARRSRGNTCNTRQDG